MLNDMFNTENYTEILLYIQILYFSNLCLTICLYAIFSKGQFLTNNNKEESIIVSTLNNNFEFMKKNMKLLENAIEINKLKLEIIYNIVDEINSYGSDYSSETSSETSSSASTASSHYSNNVETECPPNSPASNNNSYNSIFGTQIII